MNALQGKKQALAAESEVYRELLRVELENLRLYGVSAKNKLAGLARPSPWLLALAPLAVGLLRNRNGSLLRRAALGLLSWHLTERLVPFLKGWLSRSEQ